jgi:hypothetical protein
MKYQNYFKTIVKDLIIGPGKSQHNHVWSHHSECKIPDLQHPAAGLDPFTRLYRSQNRIGLLPFKSITSGA